MDPTPYYQLLRKFRDFERLSFFLPGSAKECVQTTLDLLENIKKPESFEQFMIQRSTEFENIMNILNDTEPIKSSDPFEEEKVIQLAADLTALINDYNAEYEPTFLTLISRLFAPPKPPTTFK